VLSLYSELFIPNASPTPRSLFAWLVAGWTAEPFCETVELESKRVSGPPGPLASRSPFGADATPTAPSGGKPVEYSVWLKPVASDENGRVLTDACAAVLSRWMVVVLGTLARGAGGDLAKRFDASRRGIGGGLKPDVMLAVT
jgi:hypothetical protein